MHKVSRLVLLLSGVKQVRQVNVRMLQHSLGGHWFLQCARHVKGVLVLVEIPIPNSGGEPFEEFYEQTVKLQKEGDA